MTTIEKAKVTEPKPGLGQSHFAKFSDDDWFAVPVTMVASFHKAGMEVRHVEELPAAFRKALLVGSGATPTPSNT